MSINEVLECANKALDMERQALDIKAKGHFVAVTNIKNNLGPYKTCEIKIYFIDNSGDLCTYYVISKTDRNEDNSLINKTEKEAIKEFFFSLRHRKGNLSYDSIVNGKYNGIE